MADLRFTKQKRLLNAQDFQRVFDQANIKAGSRNILILATPNNLSHSRIGFIIAKKNVRTAVQRNRIKRLLREYFRMHCDELNALYLVVLARKGLDELSNDELRALCGRLWHKLSSQPCTSQLSR